MAGVGVMASKYGVMAANHVWHLSTSGVSSAQLAAAAAAWRKL
jgi:hypothetical protein